MKFVALIFGFLATAFAFAVDYYLGVLRQPLLALWPDSSGQFLGLSLLYLVAGAGLVGGLLALLSPLSGGLMLLAAACGWFALGASVPGGYSVAIVIPLALCLLGSMAGIIAAGRPPNAAADTARLPSLEEIRREEALSRDLAWDIDEPSIPEVTLDAPPKEPVPPPSTAPAADPPPRQRPPLLVVLAVANLVLLVGLSLAVLLLYLELRNIGLRR